MEYNIISFLYVNIYIIFVYKTYLLLVDLLAIKI